MLINHNRFLRRRLRLALNTQKILQAGNMAEWTFVSNHAVVLSFLSHHASITAREVATRVGITERSVRKIINDLETGGYIGRYGKAGGSITASENIFHYGIEPSRTNR